MARRRSKSLIRVIFDKNVWQAAGLEPTRYRSFRSRARKLQRRVRDAGGLMLRTEAVAIIKYFRGEAPAPPVVKGGAPIDRAEWKVRILG
jgi:hypothetical protein